MTSTAKTTFEINTPLALFFDYGQRGADRERRAVNAQCDALGIERALEIDLRELGTTMRARQGSERRHVPLHHRNAVLLSIAASVAAQEHGTDIWIALSKDDVTWYPSASEVFVDAMRRTLLTLDSRFRLHTPFIGMTKSEVVDAGLKYGVDFATTWSCMLGYERHCGRCTQCKARKQAFRKRKVVEPPDFYHH